MSPFRSRTAFDELADRSEALADALRLGGNRLEPSAVEAARTTLEKMQGRISFDGDHTVVALAGPTGAGKSSLFNALVGAPLAEVGVWRPTTSAAQAAVWGQESADELLDWVGVPMRHRVEAGGGDGPRRGAEPDLSGLVLLDLPDIDSMVVDNRDEADRVLELVDVFVWVTDPQKYADAVLHQEYLAAAAVRAPVVIAVLNQVDRLPRDAATQILADLRRLIVDDGFDEVHVVATSTAGAPGVGALRSEIAEVVAERTASRRRLIGDVREVAATLRAGLGDREATLDEHTDARVVSALADAAGVDAVVHAVEQDFRNRSGAVGGWPFTRWLRGLRPDPLRRLGLGRDEARDSRAELRRSSLPAPSPAQRAAVDLALRDLGDRAAAGLPLRWANYVEAAAEPGQDRIGDGLDQAIVSTSLETRRPPWWPLASAAQWVFALAALVGLGWLLVLMVLGWANVHVDTPAGYPLLLLVLGVLLGLATAAACRWLALRGALRRGRQVRGRLESAIAQATGELVLAPVRAALDEHRRTREFLDSAAR